MTMSYIKDFLGWHNLKIRLDGDNNLPTFKEREVWWCSIGVNIGHEIDGKTPGKYNRPVLILKKFNQNLFWGVPLTTQVKINRYYIPIDFKGKNQCAMITHLRLYDSKRITHMVGNLPEPDFEKIKQAVKNLL